MSVDRAIVVARFLSAKGQGKAKTKEIPVRNRDTGRIVYVVPETMKEDSSRFETVSPEDLKPPSHRHKPTPARRPQKPRKPHIEHEPIPVPVPYQHAPDPPKPAKTPKPVQRVKPIKIPEPPEPVKHPLIPGRKQYRKIAERVVERVLADSSYRDPSVWTPDSG